MNTEKLLNSYYKWLKDNTVTEHDHETGWSLISTPFTGMFNDMIEVYIKVVGDRILFSDDGVTVNNLETIGINISKSPSRRRIFDSILVNFGVSFNGLELQADCVLKEFPKRKHLFLEALIGINDMFMLSKENVASVFKDDVEEYLIELGIIYTKDFKFAGVSGIDFNFDFLIAGRNTEKVLRAINYLNKTTLTTFLYAWDDIIITRKRVSKKDVSAIAVVNNEERNIKPEYLDALKIKKADYILWSERKSDENIQKLKEAA
ncbi:DUF1829 domain-containing protein [Desulfonema magnum]|uniref:DUF1828 and DUF1829 n=1 Tax=Desulfonema magnum TaxID=45655 RepID=A0A975GPL5_9BACT|nr:DUF1829 domain-containing protein [Desulfonema magnum]QTA88977.1 DUF1828 and DUF1829 [Desulfonema magnum]